jgi:hypothetical protein
MKLSETSFVTSLLSVIFAFSLRFCYGQPSISPTSHPTVHPSVRPTIHPSVRPTVHPTVPELFQPSSGQPPFISPSSHPTVHPPVPDLPYPSFPSNQPSSVPSVTSHPTVRRFLFPHDVLTLHPTSPRPTSTLIRTSGSSSFLHLEIILPLVSFLLLGLLGIYRFYLKPNPLKNRLEVRKWDFFNSFSQAEVDFVCDKDEKKYAAKRVSAKETDSGADVIIKYVQKTDGENEYKVCPLL